PVNHRNDGLEPLLLLRRQGLRSDPARGDSALHRVRPVHPQRGNYLSTATASNPVLPHAATEGTKVPFIRLDSAFPELFAELMETVERIAAKSAFTLGPELERFEEAFASFCGAEHAAGVSSGTAALEIALRALGI